MRKYHVLLCSVLPIGNLVAQQATSGTGAGQSTPTVVASTASTPAPAEPVGIPMTVLPPGSAPVTATATPATSAPTAPGVPAVIEAPVPIAPPIQSAGTVSAAATDPAPIPPQVVAAPASLPPSAATAPVIPPASVSPEVLGASSVANASSTNGSNSHGVKDFQDEDIGPVIRLLARQAGLNIVISDLVVGKLTMRLENLTPLEAIKVIVTAKGLMMDEANGVYFIKTAAEKAKEPTESGNYTFSYATADKVLPLLSTQIQSGVPPQYDARTNTIYYRDFKSNLTNIKLFLETVDRPTQQVMIEARLVEVNANPKQSYGLNWAGTVGGSSNPQVFTYGGSSLGKTTLTPSTRIDGITGLPVQVPTASSLPDPGTLQNFVLGGNGKNFLQALGGQFAILNAPQMSVTLRALNEDNDAEFLANPRIVTANNLEANIAITRNQPVPQLTFNPQTASAVFGGFLDKTYGNTLSVTPTINKDDFVTMLVKPKISNKVGDSVFTFSGASVTSPVIDSRSLESTVLIKSGDTLAIGGLLQDESTKQRTKVPVLGDVPILGYAFQERINARAKRNLLVFVTPTIIRQGYGTGLEDQVSGLKHSGDEYADPNGWRNNAKGAYRIVPTSQRQNAADYPKPGLPERPMRSSSSFKVSVPTRE